MRVGVGIYAGYGIAGSQPGVRWDEFGPRTCALAPGTPPVVRGIILSLHKPG